MDDDSLNFQSTSIKQHTIMTNCIYQLLDSYTHFYQHIYDNCFAWMSVKGMGFSAPQIHGLTLLFLIMVGFYRADDEFSPRSATIWAVISTLIFAVIAYLLPLNKTVEFESSIPILIFLIVGILIAHCIIRSDIFTELGHLFECPDFRQFWITVTFWMIPYHLLIAVHQIIFNSN
jgi:hypothetical protein